ncbi:MAG: hypothetical protein QXL06_02055 [Nitrososphaerota archaeon]
MSSIREYIPPYIFCPKCGERIKLKHLSQEELNKIKNDGYDDAKRGICRCGVVLVICHLPIPQSPSYSIFFDLYQTTKEFLAIAEERN